MRICHCWQFLGNCHGGTYGVSFQFEDESCAERRFTGGIKKYVPLNQSLDILEKTTNVVFKVSGRHVFIKSLKNEI